MPWVIADPAVASGNNALVFRVDVPAFLDEMDLEGMIGRALSDIKFDGIREKLGPIVFATPRGFESLVTIMGTEFTDVPEATVRNTLVMLAMDRQVVVLRWGGNA